jgi:hypothetical protein
VTKLLKVWQRLTYAGFLPFILLSHVLGRYRPVVWLIGEGRSGTTWVASLINADGTWREMFEPVHPTWNPAFAGLALHEYRDPRTPDPALETRLTAVFDGRMTRFRIDQTNRRLLYRGLIVKDIFASLLAGWAVPRFPAVRPVLLIRNPFAVATSKRVKQQRRGYVWADDIALLTGQPDLMRDHLGPFRDVLDRVARQDDFVLRQIALWAAIHRVLFEQFRPGAIHVMFYEEIAADPRVALDPLRRFIGGDREIALPDDRRIAAPSIVSSAADVAARREAGAAGWRRGLTDAQVTEGRAILEAFGLGGLYGEDGLPDRTWLARFPIGKSI